MAQGEAPVLATLAEMNVASISRVELDPAVLIVVRLAALDNGVTLDDLQDVLVAVAPIVGTARVLTAAGNIAEALGVAIAVAEEM